MLRMLFILLIWLHGVIHFAGFAKAYKYGTIAQLTKEITKPAGAFWIFTAILFITTAILLQLRKEAWISTGILAVIISQVLIITVWKDAKFGTIANIIVLLVAIPAYANNQLQQSAREEAQSLLNRIKYHDKSIVTRAMTSNLPVTIQKWLTRSGVIGHEKTYMVRLTQKGTMRLKPGGKWMSFDAEQYFTPQLPAFIWYARVKMDALAYLNGKDKFMNGEGSMNIKVMSLINVVDEHPGKEINEGEMLRYLAEICWFPSAALNSYITWEPINSTLVKATMNFKGVSVNGLFEFSQTGDIISFTADRYFKKGAQSTLEKWVITNVEYAVFNGIRIPCKSRVTWKLKSGDYHWLNVELTSLEYNKQGSYSTPSIDQLSIWQPSLRSYSIPK